MTMFRALMSRTGPSRSCSRSAAGQPSSEGHVATPFVVSISARRSAVWSTFLRRSRRDTFRRARPYQRLLAGQPSSEGHVATHRDAPLVRLPVDLVNLPQKVTSRHTARRSTSPRTHSGQPSSEGHVATPSLDLEAAAREDLWSTFLRRSRRDTAQCRRCGSGGLAGQPSSEGHVATLLPRGPARRGPDRLVNLPQKVTSRHRRSRSVRRRRRPSGQPSSEGHVATQEPGIRCRPLGHLVNLPQKVTSRHASETASDVKAVLWSTFLRRSRRDTLRPGRDMTASQSWSTFLRRSRRDTQPLDLGERLGRGLVNLPQKVTSRH